MKRLRRLFITALYCGPNTKPVERFVIVPASIAIVALSYGGFFS